MTTEKSMNSIKKTNNFNNLTWWQVMEVYLNTINHMFIATVSIYLTWLCYQMGWQRSRTLHVWLCTIGYQLLMCEAILSLYNQNSWTLIHSRRTKTNLHWILQAIGSSMAIAGMVIEYLTRTRHFGSIHSKLGLASGILTIIGVLNGTSAIWAPQLRKLVKPVYNRIFHNIIGTFAFLLGMVSLIYGYEKRTITNIASHEIVISLQILCGITILLSLLGGFKACYVMVQSIFSRFSRNDLIV